MATKKDKKSKKQPNPLLQEAFTLSFQYTYKGVLQWGGPYVVCGRDIIHAAKKLILAFRVAAQKTDEWKGCMNIHNVIEVKTPDDYVCDDIDMEIINIDQEEEDNAAQK